jgi:hypothetical protein
MPLLCGVPNDCLRLYRPDGATALSLARDLIWLVKTGRALKMKDAIDRRAALGALASVPALVLPAAGDDARRSDPYGDRSRPHHNVAFACSLNRTAEGKQHRKKVAKSRKR